MKLVLKFNDLIKLYTTELDYDNIVAFAKKEFDIKSSSLELSFLDEENDQITILSNEDIQVMQAVFEGKEYVKVNVKGEINNINVPQVEPEKEVIHIQEVKEVQVTKVQQPVEVEVEVEEVKVEPPQMKEEIIEVVIVEQEVIEQKKEEVIVEQKVELKVEQVQEKNKQWGHCQWKKKKFQRMEAYLNQKVAQLVDQRIKALIPCLKEQILNHAPIKNEPKGLVHEGFECKSCQQKPIVGIRYQCPTCPFFSLCQQCQVKIDHQHNLLKIKKIIPKQEEDKSKEHCFKKWFGHGHHSRGHHGRHSSGSRQKEWFMKKCWGLSTMFGGKPDDYRSFVHENDGLKPRETYKKYADLKNVSDEEFRQKFIDMRCQKLAFKFGKPAHQYKSFVEANYELKCRDLMHLLEEKGEKHVKKCWGGKRYNFNEEQSTEKKCEEKQKVQEPEIKKEEIKVEEPMLVSECKPMQQKKEQSSKIISQKDMILVQMQDIFGADNIKGYYSFINEHFEKGAEQIIQLWIDNQSKIGKNK